MKKAREAFQKAADLGSADACYWSGTGVEKNPEKTVELCMQAAEGGRGADGPLALLALCYLTGEGVPQDESIAREYCMKTFASVGIPESEIDQVEPSGAGPGLARSILDYMEENQ